MPSVYCSQMINVFHAARCQQSKVKGVALRHVLIGTVLRATLNLMKTLYRMKTFDIPRHVHMYMYQHTHTHIHTRTHTHTHTYTHRRQQRYRLEAVDRKPVEIRSISAGHTSERPATHCNTLQHFAIRCNML